MEKVTNYERKKDYRHLKDKYKKNHYSTRVEHKELFITLEEKVGLQLVLCAIILTTLIIGKLFDINSIMSFETVISRTISKDSYSYLENTSIGNAFKDLGDTIKVQIGIGNEEYIPTMSNTIEDNIGLSDTIENNTIENTIIEKK